MSKNKISSFLFIVLFCISVAYGQSYMSPFSRYGLGDINSNHFIRHRALGGTSIAAGDENTYSLSNPASYAQLKSFVFETGLNAYMYELKTAKQKYNSYDFELPYLSFALPLDTAHRWGLAIGLTPFSTTGYKSSFTTDSITNTIDMYSGAGGYSKFFIGSSIQLIKNFYIGANAGYLFGQQRLSHIAEYPDTSDYFGIYKSSTTVGNGFVFDAGAIWKLNLNKTSKLQLGASANLNSEINAHVDEYAFTYYGDAVPLADSIFTRTKNEGKMNIPLGIGGGFQFIKDNSLNRDINKDNKFTLSADFYQRSWSQYSIFGNKEPLRDYMSISGGIEWKPNSKKVGLSSGGSYIRRMYYRAGAKYIQDIYNQDGMMPVDKSVSLGLGLPFSNKQSGIYPSYLDFTFVAGQKNGSNTNSTLQQQYLNFFIGLHLSEAGWFKRDKID